MVKVDGDRFQLRGGVTRRSAIKSGACVVAGAIALHDNPATAAVGPLSVVITSGLATYTVNESAARDLGDFVSDIGGFTQRCLRADIAALNMLVFFRPDRQSDRAEVVFEVGDLFNSAPANLGAYSVSISRDGQVLAHIDVPQHFWFSRWRWQSSPRPVVADVDSLISQGLLPPYDRSGVLSKSLSTPTAIAGSNFLQVGQTTTGQVGAYEFGDTFQLGVTPGQSYTVTVAAATAGSVRVWIIDPKDGSVIAQALSPTGNANAQALAFPASSYGPYLVETLFPGRTSGTFSVAFVSGGSAGAAGSTAPPSAGGGTTTTNPGGSSGTQIAGTPAVAYQVMGLAGITPYMPTTGERDDIGLLTEPQGKFVCTASADALATVRAQAEGAGTLPWHMRDWQTNAPISFDTYPNASWYGSQYDNPNILTTSTGITLDSAHMPNLPFLPYLLTGDPYHLEDLQFQANWNWGSLPHDYRPGIPQTRAFAWSIRTLALVARVTPANVPAWLLPQSVWVKSLTVHRQFLETYVNDTNPVRSVFRTPGPIDSSRDEGSTLPAGTYVAPWEDEFLAAVLGWIVSMGFADWRTAFEWKIGSTIVRTNATSDWVRAQSTPYRLRLRQTAASPAVTDWAAAWTLNGLSYTDRNTWADSDFTYLTYTRGALVYANLLDPGSVTENLAWATGQLKGANWPTANKWRLGTGL